MKKAMNEEKEGKPRGESEEKERLNVEEFIKRERALSDIGIREKVSKFLLYAYGFSLIATFCLIFLQGFEMVSLSANLMHWLGGAVIGELAGLFALVIKSVFK